MAICTIKDADIKQVTEGKSSLKSLMTGDLSSLTSMESIQSKMNEGISNFNTAATGPAEVCTCQGGTNYLAGTQSECEEGGGTWVCKTVENFNLQQELLSLNDKSDPVDFAAGVQSIKDKFGDVVPDLNDKVAAASPALGDFFKNFSMPSLPKAGDAVLSCRCVGGTNFTAATESECIDGGGSWVCEETTLTGDLGSGLPGLSSLGNLGGGPGAFSDWGSKISGGVSSITDFFSGKAATQPSALNTGLEWDDNLGEYVSTGSEGSDTFANLVGGAQDAFSNLGSSGLKFPSADGAIPSFPKAGEIAEICECSIPGYYTKEDCENNSGVWTCRTGEAPAIPNFFGSDGLPKISPDTLCNTVENIETKDILQTDPQTGVTSIVKVADNLPKEPEVPKAPPAPPVPAPTTDNTKNNQTGGAGAAFLYTQGMVRKSIETILKGLDLSGSYHFDAWWWAYKDLIWEKGGEGSFDTSQNPFWYKKKEPKIDGEEAEKRYKIYVEAYKKKNNKDPKNLTLQDRKVRIWDYITKTYTKQERYFNKGEATTYANEEGLIKWIKETFAEAEASLKEKKSSDIVEIQEVKKEEPKPEGAVIAESKPVETPKEDVKEIEEVSELTGTQTVTNSKGNVITYNADEWLAGKPKQQIQFRHKQTKSMFFAFDQKMFDAKVRVYNTKKTETYKWSNDSVGSRPAGAWNIAVITFDRTKGVVRERIVWSYGNPPKRQAKWDTDYESGATNKLVSEVGGDWNEIEAMILEVVMNVN